jgi:hypothetical protein
VPVARNPSEPSERPTEAHISALRAFAMGDCGELEDVLADRIRRTMGLKAGASVAPKLLTRTMSMTQYMAVFEHYTHLKSQLARNTLEVSDGATRPPHASTQPAATPIPEDPVAPFGSSFAPAAVHSPAGTIADEAKAALRAEAIGWGIRAREVDHVIAHHPLAAARSLLWKARRQPSQAEALMAD